MRQAAKGCIGGAAVNRQAQEAREKNFRSLGDFGSLLTAQPDSTRTTMDCRTSALAVLAFSLGCCGCVTTQTTSSTDGAPATEAPASKRVPTKSPGLKLAMAYGELKEK